MREEYNNKRNKNLIRIRHKPSSCRSLLEYVWTSNQLPPVGHDNMSIRKEFIIIIVALCKVYCNVGISAYKGLHTKEIGNEMCIKANGSISPIGEFISEKFNLMFAMRFLSSGVDANYSLSVTDDENSENNIKIESTRDYNKDVAYKKLSNEEESEEKGKKTTYLEDYHQTVIGMFPSLTGSLSIHTSNDDSFIRFLEFEHVSKHKIDILACLFLLAEGADIPLKVEHSKTGPMLVLKEIIAKSEKENKPENTQKSEEEKNKFFITMKGMCSIEKEDNTFKNKNVLQTRAADVINFFIDNKTNPDIREGGEYAEPRTYEEFKTGKFLNNARWLIQYYIFKYLDSEEKIIEFAKTVYSMLKECIEQKKSEGSNNEVKYLESIVDKCFVKSSNANTSNAKHRAGILTTIYKESPLEDVFPFSGSIDAPEYKAISSYNRKEDSFDSSNIYSNCVEAGLLSLFCCLAYDPKTKEYNIDHMGEVSPDLKRFFDTYNKQLETDTYEMHMEWSKVVADLENENIRYLKENRNELAPGIINMLYVIAEITGRYSEEEKSLKELNTLLEEEDDTKKDILFKKVKLYTKELILSLSKKYTVEENSKLARREIKIEILKMSKCSNIKKQVDILGEVVIAYSYLNLEGGVILKHTIRYLKTTFFPSNTNILKSNKKKEIRNKKNSIENGPEKTLTDFLLMYCIEKVVESSREVYQNHKENIKVSGENNYSYPIEKLFLYNRFEKTEDRMKMIHYIRECLLMYRLEEADPWSRFLSNIIGSLPLNDLNTVKRVFFNPLYKEGLYKSFCTKVSISLIPFDKHIDSDDAGKYYRHYINNSSLLGGYLKILKIYLTIEGNISCFFTVAMRIFGESTFIKLFSVLTHDGKSMDSLLEIEEFLNGIDRGLPKYKTVIAADDMWLIWLKLSFWSDKFNDIRSRLFDKIVIDTNFSTIKGVKHEYTDENINKAISKFKKKKYPPDVIEYVLSMVESNFEYAKKLSYLLEKYDIMFLMKKTNR